MLNGSKKINSAIMFISGITLIIISGLTFVTTNWNIMTGIHKTGVMCLMTALFFFGSLLAGKIKLENTGNALYTLGCFFASLTVMGCGWFKLFGEWFSFTGGGKMFLFASATLVLLIAALTGALKYNRRHYAIIMWCTITVFVVCVLFGLDACIHINKNLINIVLAIYSLLTVLFQKKMLSIKNTALRKTYHMFVLINTAVIGIFTLFGARDFLTMSLFTICWLKISLNEKEDMAGGIISGLFMFMSIMAITNPSAVGDYIITLAAFTAAASVLAKGLPVNRVTGQVFRIFSIICMSITLCLYLGSLVSNPSLSSLAGIVVLLINNIVLIYKGENSMKYILPFTFALFAAGAAALSDMSESLSYILLSSITLSGFLCTLKFKSLRSVLSDIVTGFLIIYGFRYIPSDIFCYINILMFFGVTMYLLLENKSISRLVLSYIFPYLLIALLSTDAIPTENGSEILFHCVFLSLAFAAVLIKDTRFRHFETSMLIASLFFSIFIAPSENPCFAFIYTALWALKTYKSRNTGEYVSITIAVCEAYLSVLLLHNKYDSLSLCTLCCAVPFTVMVLSFIKSTLAKKLARAGEWSSYFAVSIMLLLIRDCSNPELITVSVFSLAVYAIVCRRGSNTFAFMPIAYIYSVITIKAVSELDIVPMTMVLYTVSIGISIVSGLSRKYQKIDYPAVFAVIPVLALLIHCNDLIWGILLSSVILLCTALTRPVSNLKSMLLSGSSMFFAAALCIQRFVTVPELIYSEYIVAVIMSFMFSLRLIWGKNEIVSIFCCYVYVVGFIRLFSDALGLGIVTDSVILTAVGFTIMLISLIINNRKWYFLGSVTLYSALALMLHFIDKAQHYELIICMVLSIISYIAVCKNGNNSFGIMPIIYVYCIIAYYTAFLNEAYMTAILYAVSIAINIIGALCKKHQKIEYTAICGIIPVITLIVEHSDPFYSILLGSILCGLSAAHRKKGNVKKVLVTCSSLLLDLALILQRLIAVPEIIGEEYIVAIIMLFAFSLRYIWGRNKVISMLIYLTGILSLVFLIIDAAISGLVADGIILGIISLIIMLAGFAAKKKKWFILGTASLIFVSIYMTKDFWLSLGWWAYLMLAGMILIGIAGANEWKKHMK